MQLVADETGLPAVAGILASLDRDVTGRAFVELPSAEDAQDLDGPPGVEVTWVVREDPHAVPGAAVLGVATVAPVPAERFYGWAVGEQKLPTAMRRHWVGAGASRNDIMFCGYWRA